MKNEASKSSDRQFSNYQYNADTGETPLTVLWGGGVRMVVDIQRSQPMILIIEAFSSLAGIITLKLGCRHSRNQAV